MKYLVVSDIHGASDSIEIIEKINFQEHIDKIIILGDVFHHGFSSNYEIAEKLNNYAGKIICLKGNCDTPYDMAQTTFNMENSVLLNIKNKMFFFTHGHLYDYNTLPIKVDYYVSGHSHINYIKKLTDLVIINPGSISYPRNGNKRSYIIIDDSITLYDIEGNILDKLEI